MDTFSALTTAIFALVSSSIVCRLITLCSICLRLNTGKDPVQTNVNILYESSPTWQHIHVTDGASGACSGHTCLSCLVLIFCSSCLFLPFTSQRCFFSANNSLSRRSSVAASACRAFIRSSMSRSFDSQPYSQQEVNSLTRDSVKLWHFDVSWGIFPQMQDFRSKRFKVELPNKSLSLTFICCSSSRFSSASTVMMRYWEAWTAELLVLILLE